MTKNNTPVKTESALSTRWDKAKQYLIGVYNELKKVHWPNRQQLMAYTGVVLVSVILMSFIIWLFDSGLSFALQKLFDAFA